VGGRAVHVLFHVLLCESGCEDANRYYFSLPCLPIWFGILFDFGGGVAGRFIFLNFCSSSLSLSSPAVWVGCLGVCGVCVVSMHGWVSTHWHLLSFFLSFLGVTRAGCDGNGMEMEWEWKWKWETGEGDGWIY